MEIVPSQFLPTSSQSSSITFDHVALRDVLAAIVDSSEDAIVSKTLDSLITSWNRGAEHVYGYTAHEAIGRSIVFLLPPDRQDEEKEILARLSRGERIDHYETQRLTKDGRLIDVSVTISPIRDSTGTIIGASNIARDITERKRTEQALRDLNATLERRVAQRTAEVEFQSAKLRELALELGVVEQRERRKLAVLLHDDIAQSLALAKLKLTALEVHRPEMRNEPEIKSIKQMLDDTIHVTRSLMNDLSPPMLFDTGFTAAVEELAARFREQHGLEIDLRAQGKVALSDDLRSFLFQAVRELLTNILKYSGAKRAELVIDKTPERVLVIVKDRGAGFNLSTLPRRPSEHRGFGLFNIRERAILLGGNLEITSTPGEGTTCRLEIPLKKVMDSPAVSAPPVQGAIRLVLADDHAAVREVMAQLLEQMPGIELIGQATTGPETLEMCMQLHPDVLLLDISLPGIDGIEITRRLTRDAPGIRIIGLSIHDSDKARQICEAGAVTFVSKDCGPEILERMIRTYAIEAT